MSGPDNRPVVLLVTPDEFELYPLRTYLEQEGFRTHRVASDGVISTLGEMGPDLVLVSQGVDDRAGLDVCARVTERSSVPVVMLTSWDSRDVEVGLSHGVDHYVVCRVRRRQAGGDVR